MSDRATTTAGPGSAVKTRRTGSSRPPMARRVDLQAGARGGEGGADLEHVGAEDQLVAGGQVVGVVLHEGGAAGQAGAHDLGGADQDGGLPVAFGAEAVAVGHQPLHGQAGQLAQAAEVLEVGGERAEAAGVEEGAQARARSRRRSAATRAVPRRAAARARRRRGPAYSATSASMSGVGRGVDGGDQVVDAPGVDLDPEDGLGLGLVALGDGDVAHVVAEPGQLQDRVAAHPAAARAQVPTRAVHRRVGDVPGDRLARRCRAGSGCSRTRGRRARPGSGS